MDWNGQKVIVKLPNELYNNKISCVNFVINKLLCNSLGTEGITKAGMKN